MGQTLRSSNFERHRLRAGGIFSSFHIPYRRRGCCRSRRRRFAALLACFKKYSGYALQRVPAGAIDRCRRAAPGGSAAVTQGLRLTLLVLEKDKDSGELALSSRRRVARLNIGPPRREERHMDRYDIGIIGTGSIAQGVPQGYHGRQNATCAWGGGWSTEREVAPPPSTMPFTTSTPSRVYGRS